MRDSRSLQRALHLRAYWPDGLIAVVLTSLALGVAALNNSRSGVRSLDVLAIVLLLGQTLPVAVRRRHPTRVLCITGLAILAYSAFNYPISSGSTGVLISTYNVAAHTPRRTAILGALYVAVGMGLTLINSAAQTGITSDVVIADYGIFGTAWIIGDWVRVRREYVTELEAKAAGREREREEQARLAIAEERSRIARELHDVVAHNVSVMVVQATAAKRVLEADPTAAHEALGSIETSGRIALTEMRRMLGVLRSEDRPEALEPQPGIGQIERLAAQVRDAGLDVDLEIQGWPRMLSRGADLTAYRIVQEALTNTLKHAGQARAWVTLTYGDHELQIDVRDNGRGALAGLKGSGAGQGLVGMHERALLYGGSLEVGPMMSGGWRVLASLPVEDSDQPGMGTGMGTVHS
jgi:signal transduction histidine kinase